MNNFYRTYADKFDARKPRERALLGLTLLVAILFSWWHLFAAPLMMQSKLEMEKNSKTENEVSVIRTTLDGLRKRIAEGVHRDKEVKLVELQQSLKLIEQRMLTKTVELIDPEQMFKLMTQLIYKESNLKLLSLKRREVKPAIEFKEDGTEGAGIYRHVLEVQFSGKYLDILKYMQSLEKLDWKLIWDEIEIVSDEYPKISVKVVISTLSTRKEWVGV